MVELDAGTGRVCYRWARQPHTWLPARDYFANYLDVPVQHDLVLEP